MFCEYKTGYNYITYVLNDLEMNVHFMQKMSNIFLTIGFVCGLHALLKQINLFIALIVQIKYDQYIILLGPIW